MLVWMHRSTSPTLHVKGNGTALTLQFSVTSAGVNGAVIADPSLLGFMQW